MSRNDPRVDNERIATILVEALYFGDIKTSEKWGIHKRTVQNYRAKLKSDNTLVSIFSHKKVLFENEWADEIPVTVRMAMRYIQRATEELSITPEGLHSITGALKILAELGLTKDMIDAKLEQLGYNRAESSITGEVAYSQISASTE